MVTIIETRRVANKHDEGKENENICRDKKRK